MKLDENICITSHYEEIRLLVILAFSMCGDYKKLFMKYIDDLPFIPELNEILETNKEEHFQFILENLINFFKKIEKELDRKNKNNIENKKAKNKQKRK